jgi:hypothetical protein
MSSDKAITERSVYGAGEMIAEIGGMQSALFVSFTAFVFMFGQWNVQAKMANRLYRYEAEVNGLDKKGSFHPK